MYLNYFSSYLWMATEYTVCMHFFFFFFTFPMLHLLCQVKTSENHKHIIINEFHPFSVITSIAILNRSLSTPKMIKKSIVKTKKKKEKKKKTQPRERQ